MKKAHSILGGRLGRFLILLSAFALSACAASAQAGGDYAQLPAGRAFAEGREIFFIHTEASDAGIAETLTNMMNSPVLFVPSLANVPESALAKVFVFENGIQGSGPLGFQPDVFDNPPGAEGYSPLRRIVLIRWMEGAAARELKSAAEVVRAESEGELTASQAGVVVNMLFVVWDGDKR